MVGGSWAALIPVVTLALGYWLKGKSDEAQDNRRLQAERTARSETRREKRAERRDDLQRETLLELQQTAANLFRLCGRTHFLDAMAVKGGHAYGSQQIPEEVSEGLASAQRSIMLLQSRLLDAQLRSLVETFRKGCMAIAHADDENSVHRALKEVNKGYELLQNRAGQLVREMDDDLFAGERGNSTNR